MRNIIVVILVTSLFSCSLERRLGEAAQQNVLADETLRTAHVGISIYEPATGKYWYNYQGDKYFVPASNTKIPTCYAAMKYLGDSLVGLRYNEYIESNRKRISIQPTGDPTFLHPDFKDHPVLDFFQKDTSMIFALSMDDNWKEKSLGSGWSWNDYSEAYMTERSSFPIYGNVIRFYGTKPGLLIKPGSIEPVCGFCTDVDETISFTSKKYSFSRLKDKNVFLWDYAKNDITTVEVPFITSRDQTIQFLKDTVKGLKLKSFSGLPLWKPTVIHSQPTDSLLKPMMHRSDNFFAEQSLLMVSNEHLGYMNDAKIIDTLLKTDFKDLPQKPRWVDGSGLSRYNLFSPQDFVFILNKMKNEFGMTRIKNILATGGEGTLSSYYKKDSTFIYAKTGTLSGVVAISGFLSTKKGKELIFSVLVNNHQGSATNVRRAVEKFIEGVREKY